MSRKGYKRVKSLFDKYEKIPEKWSIKRLGELLTGKPQYGSGDPALPFNPTLPRYVRITDIDDDGNLKNTGIVSVNFLNNEKHVLEENDFLFARTGSVGRTFVFAKKFGKCVYAGYLIRFKLNSQKILPQFLHYYTHSKNYWRWVTFELTHGVQPNLNAQQYSKLKIPIPCLKEQQKIASILGRVDALIDATQKTIDTTRRLKISLMQQLLTKGIGHKKFKKVKWLFGKEIEIPENWDLRQVKRLAHINSELISDNYKFDKIAYIDISSIKNFQIIKLEKFQLNERPSRAQRILKQNDIIVSTVRPYLKAYSLINIKKPNLVCSTGFAVVRSKFHSDTNFLFNYFQSHIFYINYLKKMEGMAYPAITSTVVSNSLIPTPNTRNEQQKIASILSGVDAYIQKNSEYVKKLERLKKGLMQKLLTGEIRVNI